MSAVILEIKAPDLLKQLEKFKLLDGVWRKLALHWQARNAQIMAQRWKLVAPVDQGLYQSSIDDEVRMPTGEIVQAVASTSVRSPGGFPYPEALEDSVKYHYRSTPRRGQRTAGQATRAFQALVPQLEANGMNVADGIAAFLVVR